MSEWYCRDRLDSLTYPEAGISLAFQAMWLSFICKVTLSLTTCAAASLSSAAVIFPSLPFGADESAGVPSGAAGEVFVLT